ncbi:P-loop containing nucleoside triphosphate hydrolase protein [Globomyces pollinis-pini]|nr:P-loop containing nucleoside triphosphate hydrolase protein [Globomyces pollinis-pini]
MSLVPFAFAQLLIPIIRVLFFMMTLHKTISFEIYILDAIKTLNEITDNLMSQADSLSTMDTKFTFKIVRNELARITSIGNESRKKLDLADVFSKYELQLKTTNKLLNSVKNPWKHSDVLIVPGNENNRCHDNDFEHIGAISILPTMGELLSELQPNLPGNHMDVEKAHWLPEGPERLLDTHFRLLREDLVGPIRDNITSYFKFLANPSQFTKKYYNGRLQATPTGKLSAQKVGSVDICVHEGVIFESLQISRHNGISIVLKFDHPPNLPTKPKIKQYWESGGNLANGAMVGLVIKHPDMGNTPLKVIFGCVTDRDEKKLVRDRPEISVVFPVKYLDGEVFKCLLNCKGHVLIENNNIMFESYRPILATLQNMNPATLPFAKYLCYPSRRQNEQSDKVTDPPLYAMVPNYMINLNNLWPGIPNYAFDPNNATERKSCLEFLSKHNAFDKSQAAAFINALISDISCIQGPPGTGKSFIGVQLVRTILQNRSFITPNAPILLICFTNHALDQFLLHLLKLGIDSIARLGGNSKVEELQELSAFNLERFEKSRGQKRGEWECFREMDELRDKLHKLNNNIFKWEPNWKDISEHLTIFQPDQYMSFLVMLEYIEEEQRTWTKKGKKDFDIIDYWKNGEDLALTQHEELEDQPDSDKITRKGINRFSLLSVDGNLSKGSSSAKPPTVNKPKPKKIVVKDIEELMELPDVWLMIIPERQRLLAYWKETIFDSRLQQINYLSTKIDKCQKKLQTLRDSGLADILRNKEIIGVTTTGAAKYSNLIKSLNYRIVICEEAGEVLESHILASLQPTVQQLIMIGDHFQLRPHLALHSLSAESNTGKKYQLDLSLFERLQNPNYKFPLQTLEVQRRMRPEISELIRKTLYPSLSDSIMVEDRENVPGVKDNVFFMDHTAPEDDKGQGIQGNSHSNEFEADYVIGLLQFLLRKGYKPDDIVILTPYVGQLLKIRKKLQSLYTVFISDRDTSQLKVEFQEEELNDEVNYEVIAEKKKLGQCIRVSTIDNYQGEESKIVIISLVRNKKGKKGSIGFF